MMIRFLGSMLSIVMLELSNELSLSPLIVARVHLSKVYVLRLLFMFVTRLTFTKFVCVILVHWCVILIMCKMTCEQLTSNM